MRTNLGWNLDPSITYLTHGRFGACPEAVLAHKRSVRDRMKDGIEIPIGPWPVRAGRSDGAVPRILIRISAQRYNEPADYERLASALRRRLTAE